MLRYFIPLLFSLAALLSCERESLPAATQEVELRGEASYYDNPVLPEESGDPFCMKLDDTYYLYLPKQKGGGQGGTVELFTSNSIEGPWNSYGTVYDNSDFEDIDGNTPRSLFAPEVIRVEVDGVEKFYLYVVNVIGGRNADIAVVEGSSPTNFDPSTAKQVLGTQARRVRFIDPSPFLDDDNTLWLSYKVRDYQGNGTRLEIRQTELDRPDVLVPGTEETFAVTLRAPEVTASFAILEHPYVYKEDGVYYLFYSSGNGDRDTYKIGYRTATSIVGPYTGGTDSLMYTGQNEGVVSPGATSIVRECTTNHTWMVYRQKEEAAGGFGNRQVYADEIKFKPQKRLAECEATRGRIQGSPNDCK